MALVDAGAMGDLTFTSVHLTRFDPERNMARYYAISVQPTLFGEVSVMRRWGRIGTRGRDMMITYEDQNQAKTAVQDLQQQKCSRGYGQVKS